MEVEQGKNKVVWIACRATPECSGNQAEVIMTLHHDPFGIGGSKIADGPSKSIRYKCLTCNREFHITN